MALNPVPVVEESQVQTVKREAVLDVTITESQLHSPEKVKEDDKLFPTTKARKRRREGVKDEVYWRLKNELNVKSSTASSFRNEEKRTELKCFLIFVKQLLAHVESDLWSELKESLVQKIMVSEIVTDEVEAVFTEVKIFL